MGPTLCDSVDCSPLGSSLHGIFQARILEWVAMSSRGSSQPRDRTWVSCTAGRFFTVWAPINLLRISCITVICNYSVVNTELWREWNESPTTQCRWWEAGRTQACFGQFWHGAISLPWPPTTPYHPLPPLYCCSSPPCFHASFGFWKLDTT